MELSASLALIGELYVGFKLDLEPEDIYQQTFNIGHEIGTLIAYLINFR